MQNQIKLVAFEPVTDFHESLHIFIADRNRCRRHTLPLQPTGGIKDNVALRVTMKFSEVFPANAVEIWWTSLFLCVGHFR